MYGRLAMEAMLPTEDAILVLLDYAQLNTESEAATMANLKKSNPQLLQRLAQRVFFVVNKCDAMERVQVNLSTSTPAAIASMHAILSSPFVPH
jgi:hypothetical protein